LSSSIIINTNLSVIYVCI
jgi:hypothetical protein